MREACVKCPLEGCRALRRGMRRHCPVPRNHTQINRRRPACNVYAALHRRPAAARDLHPTRGRRPRQARQGGTGPAGPARQHRGGSRSTGLHRDRRGQTTTIQGRPRPAKRPRNRRRGPHRRPSRPCGGTPSTCGARAAVRPVLAPRCRAAPQSVCADGHVAVRIEPVLACTARSSAPPPPHRRRRRPRRHRGHEPAPVRRCRARPLPPVRCAQTAGQARAHARQPRFSGAGFINTA